MTDNVIQFPIKITPLKEHMLIKEHILAAIAEQPEHGHMIAPNSNIVKCDWDTSRYDPDRKWLQILNDPLYAHLDKWNNDMGYSSYGITEIWFQQYAHLGRHAWHTHSSNFTNVYYVNLPSGGGQTEWIDPITKRVCTFDVNEGDIVTFPSWVVHRAPQNDSTEVKTIISWNLDVELDDKDAINFYGE
jgi:hypothetical protein|tara:strand:+ start:186 stop:749 length:564 start_codon:yes stop_codon:yes gene_type:complete